MKAIKKLLLVAVTVSTLFGCKKKDPEKAKFAIKINDTSWSLQEIAFRTVYYPKFQQLFIEASDGTKWFHLGVNLNPASLLNTYVFEPNGSNAAAIQESIGYFMSDNNVADAGGSFSLTAFDTAQKKLSCNFQVTCFSGDRIDKKILSSTLNDLSFTIDTLSDVGNIMTCTVNGAKTTNWQTREWNSLVNCSSGRLDLIFSSMADNRSLSLNIPFAMGTGSHPITSSQYDNCNPNLITGQYDIDSTYYPTSGTINITKLDVAQRKMQANFSLNVKDSRGEQIQITNGSFTLNTWRDHP